jgi:dolichol-phosphate mannosyltransferase
MHTDTPRTLSLVIPAWNEAANIGRVIAEAERALGELCSTPDARRLASGLEGAYEIIVVDDGSSDATSALAAEAAARNPRVTVIRHPENRGYGAALRTGFTAARLDYVAFTDADCQFDLHDLGQLLERAADAPIVCGFRVDRKDTARRRFFSWGYNRLVRLLLDTRVRDVDCALKVFRRETLLEILPDSPDFFVNTEMLTKARLKDIDVVEVGVSHRPRLAGHSKVSLLDVPRTLARLLPFWWSLTSGTWAGTTAPAPRLASRSA